MSNVANELYSVNLSQAAAMIRAGGSKRTVLLQGHMGTGKSSLLNVLAKQLPKHTPCYFDCTTKDLGDISIPQLQMLDKDGGDNFVRFVTNEELGVHLNKPIIIMVDEYGKANTAVKNAMLRLMLERKMGSYTLHPESLIFATTNLGAEGVGDLLMPHHRNRITMVKTRKPTNVEWIEDFAINAEVDHILIAWVTENPHLFASFEDVKNPDDNQYIFHPGDPSRVSFVTPRSLEAASDWLKVREHMDDKSLTAALIGTIGPRAAGDLSAYIRVADEMPRLEEIKKDPHNAKVPRSPSAVCMVVHRTLQCIDKTWVDAWMDYMERLDNEAQNLFAMQVRRPTYGKQSEVMTNKKFTSWCLLHNYVFGAEKK